MKNPSIERLLTSMGYDRSGKRCSCCGSTNLTFRDDLSWKEFHISLMCQSCQDEVFKPEEE